MGKRSRKSFKLTFKIKANKKFVKLFMKIVLWMFGYTIMHQLYAISVGLYFLK